VRPPGAAVVLALAAAGCGADAVEEPGVPPSGGQTVTLRWTENCGTRTSPLLIRTRRVVADRSRWTITLSVTNRTGVPLRIVRAHVSGGTEFGVSFFRTAARSEVEARVRVGRGEPDVYADAFDPPVPPALLQGESWSGSFSGRGRLTRGGPIRIVLGRFIVGGRAPPGFPERFFCISERVLRLR
jgi:hypothetical protein